MSLLSSDVLNTCISYQLSKKKKTCISVASYLKLKLKNWIGTLRYWGAKSLQRVAVSTSQHLSLD